MSYQSSSSSGGVDLFGLLGLLFIGLKLGGVIRWSWWLVTLPLWGGAALTAVLAVGVAVVMVIGALTKRSRNRQTSRELADSPRPIRTRIR
jgi:hypothetical protein